MNEQNIYQPNEHVQDSKHIWIIIIVVIAIIMIFGSGVYVWQQSREKSLQEKISLLQDQINQLQQKEKNQDVAEQIQPDQNQPDSQQITDAQEFSLKTHCENNGGKFLGTMMVINGGYSPVCLLPEGRYCEEFGYNECVESKGYWQP